MSHQARPKHALTDKAPADAGPQPTLMGENNDTVENPINRYSLGSDDPLVKNEDGTVTLYLQSTSPGKDKDATLMEVCF
jgi:hypothetical protein